MARTAGQIALITAGTLATGALGYAIYFDYMRRNSPEFRRSLRMSSIPAMPSGEQGGE